MPVNYIVLAIPVFFLLIGIEILATRLLERDYYRLSDSVNDLSCGIIQQLLEVFLKTALFAGYLFLYESHRFFSIPAGSAAAWGACFLGVDFLYYWFHRWSHEVNAGWAAHIVHHQSEEMNLTVALRQGAFQPAFSWVFYLPLAVLGFPPLMFLTLSSFNTLYQFWIHTRAIGRLGPLEWVLNTPSHHRVHHGRNPKYIDRNHGGTLIVWDRLFGTFRAEEEEPVYGITRPLASWNPVWANLHYWVDLFRTARRARRWADRARVFLKPPGWMPEEMGGFAPAPEVDPRTYRKYDAPAPGGLKAYVLVQFVLVNLATTAFLFQHQSAPGPIRLAAALAIVASVASLGGLLDLKPWALRMELARSLLLGLAAALLLRVWPASGVIVATAGALAWLLRYRRSFLFHRDPKKVPIPAARAV
jgi:sterol desaturase/sphingolipid hydroxylase (fatty acid hydroxylase superfamily)